MPARNLYHDCVKNAMVKDGWKITHDPMRLRWGAKDLYVDLGAEQLLAAEKEEKKIAIEIKSFIGASIIGDLEQALGQYVFVSRYFGPCRAKTIVISSYPKIGV